ncbi:MAG TPA: hypothetical protein VIZ28_09240 [Chitinophagaceae bacterium]
MTGQVKGLKDDRKDACPWWNIGTFLLATGVIVIESWVIGEDALKKTD